MNKYRHPTSFRFSVRGDALLKILAEKQAISKRDMMEILIRKEARVEGIDIMSIPDELMDEWYVDCFDTERTFDQGFPTMTYKCKNESEASECKSLASSHFYKIMLTTNSVSQSPIDFNRDILKPVMSPNVRVSKGNSNPKTRPVKTRPVNY